MDEVVASVMKVKKEYKEFKEKHSGKFRNPVGTFILRKAWKELGESGSPTYKNYLNSKNRGKLDAKMNAIRDIIETDNAARKKTNDIAESIRTGQPVKKATAAAKPAASSKSEVAAEKESSEAAATDPEAMNNPSRENLKNEANKMLDKADLGSGTDYQKATKKALLGWLDKEASNIPKDATEEEKERYKNHLMETFKQKVETAEKTANDGTDTWLTQRDYVSNKEAGKISGEMEKESFDKWKEKEEKEKTAELKKFTDLQTRLGTLVDILKNDNQIVSEDKQLKFFVDENGGIKLDAHIKNNKNGFNGYLSNRGRASKSV